MKPEAIVIHIMEGSLAGTDTWFASRESQVSAHYSVGKSGEVHQYVDEPDTANHAGIVEHPTWVGLKRDSRGKPINPNCYTIGIEHEGRDGDLFTDAQYEATAALIADISARWHIPIDPLHVIPHHAIRASKPCPGSGCDFTRLIEMAQRAQV